MMTMASQFHSRRAASACSARPTCPGFRVDDFARAAETSDTITTALAAKHLVHDFSGTNQAGNIMATMKTQSSLTLLLGFTAALSLLVGGIGIMNMMLMTVAERTREI